MFGLCGRKLIVPYSFDQIQTENLHKCHPREISLGKEVVSKSDTVAADSFGRYLLRMKDKFSLV
jgi:hypothetical protein